MAIDRVSETPRITDLASLYPILASHGNAINRLIAQLDVVLTANLKPGSTAMNGTTVIENAGGSTRNLIVYQDGLRFRVALGAAF